MASGLPAEVAACRCPRPSAPATDPTRTGTSGAAANRMPAPLLPPPRLPRPPGPRSVSAPFFTKPLPIPPLASGPDIVTPFVTTCHDTPTTHATLRHKKATQPAEICPGRQAGGHLQQASGTCRTACARWIY